MSFPVADIALWGLLFIVFRSLAFGLSVTSDGVRKSLQGRGQLVVLSLIANFVFVPALTLGVLATYESDISIGVRMAFAASALAAGGVFVPMVVGLGRGEPQVAYGLVVVQTIASIVIVPLALPAALAAVGVNLGYTIWDIAWPILAIVGVPFLAGFLFRRRHERVALEASGYLGPISILALLACVVLYYLYYWDLAANEWGSWALLFTLVFPFVYLLIGYLSSPPFATNPRSTGPYTRATKLTAALATGQRGTLILFTVLMFSFASVPFSGMVGTTAGLIAIIMFVIISSATRRKPEKEPSPANAPEGVGTPAATPEPANRA